MTDRHRRILASLVAEYIEQGEPVSSAWLAEHSALGLSSATVRNILARLEEQGLVRQPHTSAGRIPTDSGYRLYVDALLESRRKARPIADVEARLRRSGTVGDLLEHASQELSRASHQIGFAHRARRARPSGCSTSTSSALEGSARAGHRRRRRRPRHAQGHRDGRARTSRRR